MVQEYEDDNRIPPDVIEAARARGMDIPEGSRVEPIFCPTCGNWLLDIGDQSRGRFKCSNCDTAWIILFWPSAGEVQIRKADE